MLRYDLVGIKVLFRHHFAYKLQKKIFHGLKNSLFCIAMASGQGQRGSWTDAVALNLPPFSSKHKKKVVLDQTNRRRASRPEEPLGPKGL